MSAAEGKMRGLFVTGTDTGVGKTAVCAALALFLRSRGVRVGVMKPVETGVEDPAGLGADGRLLAWAAGVPEDAAAISPYRLRAPLAPSVAAEEEGVRIDVTSLLEGVRQAARNCEYLLVEGAGGLMVPLRGGYLMADFARDLGLPLLVVARTALGTINHTLLTIFAARNLELPVAGFILNGMPAAADAASACAPHALASLASADLLGVLPWIEGDEQSRSEVLAREIARLPTLGWLERALGIKE